MSCSHLVHDTSKQIVDRLRAIRLDKLVQLPAIVVGGDTSSGKSSLLTAISGLQFPSNTGLTTRCPTEVILTKSETKSAVVTLQHFNGMSDKQLGFRRDLKDDRSDFAAAVTEATELLTEGHEANYITPNSIVVHAAGPDLCDLTLIDLPGLVAATGQNESSDIIKSIRDMIDGHMRSSRTVILCVLPANNDFHNSAILTMAKDCDPGGVRTLGIITKPDLVDKGSEGDVIELATNRKARLELGWHSVKLRSQQDIATKSMQDAEKEEEAFYAHEPWCALDKDSVGIPELRKRLQRLLLQRVHAELPKVFEEAQKRLRTDEAELSKLGLSCNDLVKKRQVFATSCGQCAAIFEAASAGRYFGEFFENVAPEYGNNLRAQMFVAEAKFREEIAKTRCMCMGEYGVGDPVMYQAHEGVITSEAPDGKFAATLKISQQTHVGLEADALLPARGDLLALLRCHRGDTLPGFDSDVVFRLLVSRKLAPWLEPSKKLCSETVELLQDFAARLVDHATPPSLPALRHFLKTSARQAIDQSAEQLEARMQELLRTERERPYTQNRDYTDLLNQMRNEQLKRKLAKLKDANGNVNYDGMLGVLATFGMGVQSAEEASAVELEFRLAAYLKVASKRIIDEMPKVVNTVLVLPVLDKVRNLQTQVADTQLDRIVLEDGSASRKRAALEDSTKVLQDAVRVLQELFQSQGV